MHCTAHCKTKLNFIFKKNSKMYYKYNITYVENLMAY